MVKARIRNLDDDLVERLASNLEKLAKRVREDRPMECTIDAGQPDRVSIEIRWSILDTILGAHLPADELHEVVER